MRFGFMALAALLTVPMVWTVTGAKAAELPFSADAVSQLGGEVIQKARILRDQDAIRLEYARQGKQLIQIMKPKSGEMLVLDPATKTFLQFKGKVPPAQGAGTQANPCAAPPSGMTCTPLGAKMAGTINAEAYRISGGKTQGTMTVYWDPKSKQVVRRESSDGKVMQVEFVAKETVLGRDTLHWKATYTEPEQQPQIGEWWLDPDLGVRIREQLPNGELRELRNLAVGPVDTNLFQVPQGYRKVEPQQAPSAGMRQGGAPQGGARQMPQRQQYPAQGGQYRYPSPYGR
ncbi:hypothetical protein [Magnetospira sp. QH-2]|uniref:hypothetical protein n=1 Tax=Magnetospira sp. (strain QH-2) TaxID=1288970 RepID=UPI0003E81307|nr:hypothetical protein [Magnetospira sp. QH-2]CCQ75181.1 exported protein of unknown function [Magnetospira sp. QH-2]